MKIRRWLGALLVIGVLIAAATAWLLAQPSFGGKLEGERLARAQASPQYHDHHFVNVVPKAPYSAGVIWALIEGQFLGKEMRQPPGPIPVLSVDPASLKEARPSPGLRAFWIGHASTFIELDGVRLLVDPVFSERVSPLESMGPQRFHPPPLGLDALPPIDAVLITHDHYDHLDMGTARHLASRGTQFFVPLGIGAHLQVWGVPLAQIKEMEWWQEQSVRGLRIVSTPARHYSGRGVGDASATLWTSWSVLGSQHRFFVSGDTGYSDHFKAIGEKFGPFDLSFVKIGAYGPGAPWLDIHMSAEDAVRAHRDVRARRMFPVHWGTFNLAFHDWDEPIKRALVAAQANQVELLTPRVGEIVDAEVALPVNRWWEAVKKP